MHLLDLDFSRSKRYIIKPKRGYYATAVRTISAHTNLRQLQIEMQAELAERSRYYPETMLSSQAMIVEEFIGQPIENSLGLDEAELAVDLFYDRNGEPVIVGLYHHPHPTCSAYFHTLYYTSQAIYARFSRMVIDFFESLQNQGLGLKNFPVHAEFKVIGARLIPIEINPYRFGGYGLADLLHHACGINPYETYFESRHPDWPSLWKGKSALYACVVGYNGEGVDLQIHEPQRAEFKAMFGSSLLHFGPLDHMNCPLFAMAYLETHEQDLLHEVLTLDYRKFFQAKPTITERAGTPC